MIIIVSDAFVAVSDLFVEVGMIVFFFSSKIIFL